MVKFTIKDFNEKYTSDDICLHEIFLNRYGRLKICPNLKCYKRTKFHKVKGRKCYACQLCGYQLHPLAGTIFHKSDTPLKSWFYAIFLFANAKNGVSGKELQRQLGVTYKTAWRMAKQIRLLFQQSKTPVPLTGPVEMDETYYGKRNTSASKVFGTKRGRGAPGKTTVFGIIERGGQARMTVTPDIKTETLMPFIEENVAKRNTVYTDEYRIYSKLKNYGYTHKKILHARKNYVKGDIHTNTIEGFWSQLKRSIGGTYHYVSPKYLQSYVDEFSYRYNLRNFHDGVAFSSMISEVGKPVL